MQKRKKPRYSKEFKERAVQLSMMDGIDGTAAQLGVSKSSIVRWRAELGESPVRNTSQSLTAREMKNLIAEQQRRIELLEKEKKLAEMEREILKKATVFFVRENG
jgi:transposase